MKKIVILSFIFWVAIFDMTAQNPSLQWDTKILRADSLLKKDDSMSVLLAREVLEKAGANPSYAVKSYLIQSIAYKNMGRYKQSLSLSQKGLEKAKMIADTVNMIKLYSSRGIVHYLLADYIRANEAFISAVQLYEAYGIDRSQKDLSPLHYARILNNVASTYIKSGRKDLALKYFISSIKVREKYKAPKRMIAISKLNLGSLYLTMDDFINSKKWLQSALQDATQINDSALMAKSYGNLGINAKKRGDTLQAISDYQNSLLIWKKLNNEREKAIVLQNLGLLKKDQKKYNEALKYLKKALVINQRIGKNTASIHLSLCELFFAKGNNNQCIKHCNKAVELSKKNGNILTQSKALQLLYQAYKNQKKYDLALQSFEQYASLQEQTHNKETEKYIQNLKTQFETEQKEQEITYLKKLNQTEHIKAKAIQDRQRIAIFTALLGIALLTGLLLFFLNKRKRDKALYDMEKKLLETQLHNKELKSKELEMEVNYRSKQLTTHALNMMQRNKILSEIREKLTQLSKQLNTPFRAETKSIIRDINRMQRTEKDWDLFKKYFEKVNKDFYTKLHQINPDLTSHDDKLAALISLNLNIKETAAVLNITPNSVKLARHRLRKKLGLNKEDDLYNFLSSL